MRYAKDIPSIRAIGDRASHIATRGAGIKVESGELNFVFIEDGVIGDFTKLYCNLLPLLMYYAVYVIKIYAAEHNLYWDFVRDKDNDLYINNTEFSEDMADEHWVPLEKVF